MKSLIQKLRCYKLNRGMTYVELIVVLSIFAIFSGMAIFNYRDFQGKVDVKNLANDVALKVVQAQKDSLSGRLPLPSQSYPQAWKPSYGIYFNTTSNSNNTTGKKIFYYFVDTNSNHQFDYGVYSCPNTGECMDRIDINKNNSIATVKSFTGGTGSTITGDLAITFTRPNSGASFYNGVAQITAEYIEVTVSTPYNVVSHINIYPSGRIQIN